MSLGLLYVLGEVSIQVLCPFFYWVVCLLRVDSCELFIYFGDQTLVWGIIGKYVFPYCWFSFHFNAVFFIHAEAFYFYEIPFVYSFLYVPCPRGHIYKILLRGISEIFLPMFSSRTLMVSWLIFKSFIHREFLFMYGVSWYSSFIFWGNSILFSIGIAPVCKPTNSALGFPFLHNLTSPCCLLVCLWWPFWPVWGGISLWF